MTLAIKNSAVSEEETAAGRRKASQRSRGPQQAIGFRIPEPVVDLMPPQIRAERKARSTRRVLIYSVLGVVVLVILGAGGAAALSVAAQSSVAEGQAESQSLLQQQQSFLSTRVAQQQVEVAKAAQQVAGSTEIDWAKYYGLLEATVPAGVTLTALQTDSASPIAIYQQADAPLQGARVATVKMTADAGSLDAMPAWLTALGSVPGVVDAITDDASRDATTGAYTVNVTVHLNEKAYDHRLTGKGE
ncbi:hypothetical protein ASF88_02775 [Leifsonia sp. Leaf336]|uniref:hypothetical protein n=1 Tax=Leifsonia sp. Leaf336 TaxID=1736341 RepID=UPI0006F859CA|nr:hypothetical protein [Leifsonia sp. Leaf336]KQR53792.1 hypothetical protein ASF88_02775 [Leifsonia sp. Leaf336]